jgi:hypothetical protein
MSYMKFVKIEDLKWQYFTTLRGNTAEVDKRFLESKYPSAKVYMQKESGQYYHVFIEFQNEADEAEFILKELK